jgi:hypothetical protein
MRVMIVGPASERARVRAELDGAVDVVAEHDTLAEARSAGHDVDATIIAESRRRAPALRSRWSAGDDGEDDE